MNNEPMTDEQRKIFNAACGDLAEQILWPNIFGELIRIDKDDWRHFLSAMALRREAIRAVDMGEGPPGFVILGASSLLLTVASASDAITLAFSIGDDPAAQGLDCPRVRWGPAVCKARYLAKGD